MKKLISLALAALVVSANAGGVYQYQPFLNGVNLYVSNNTAVTYGLDGPWFYDFTVGTNKQAGLQNSVNTNLYNPEMFKDILLFANERGDVNNNIAIWITINDTNAVECLGPGQNQLLNTNNFLLTTNYVNSSNVVTFVFATSGDGLNFGTRTPTDRFTISLTGSNNVPQTIRSNLPAGNLGGVKAIRLISVTTDNSPTSPGTLINRVGVGGYVP